MCIRDSNYIDVTHELPHLVFSLSRIMLFQFCRIPLFHHSYLRVYNVKLASATFLSPILLALFYYFHKAFSRLIYFTLISHLSLIHI